MIIEMTAVVCGFVTFVIWLFIRSNAKVDKSANEINKMELQMKADKQNHDQYMELQKLTIEPSSELLAVRLAEAEAEQARYKAELEKEYSRKRHY